MRHLKLMISAVIAFVGILVYFVSVPKVDDEALVHLTVEAGDEALLEETYFNGFIYDLGSFHFSEEEVYVHEELPYLEKLDAPNDYQLRVLQEEYPELVNELLYSPRRSEFTLLNSEDYLISGNFQFNESNYSIDPSTIYLSTVDKETKEQITDAVKRPNAVDGDYVMVMGIYEAYPVVKLLLHTQFWEWETDSPENTSILTTAEHNFETKNYTETTLDSDAGDVYSYQSQSSVLENNHLQLLSRQGSDNMANSESTQGSDGLYVYNFDEDTITPLEDSNKYYFIDNSQLYSLEAENDQTLFKTYNETGDEVVHETPLNLEIQLNLFWEYPMLVAEVIGDELYITQSQLEEESGGVAPTPYQVFDTETGESLLVGEIQFDTESQVNATGAVVNEIGKLPKN